VVRQFGERRGEYQGKTGFSALSPDGKLVVVGGSNETTQLWRVADGKKIGELGEKGGSGFSAAYSVDGRTVAIAADKIVLWDLATGEEIRRLVGHGPWVFALAFSPDGKMLASAGSDKAIRLWELATGQERRRFEGHLGDYFRVTCLAFSPDGKVLASAGSDTTILLWGVTPLPRNTRRRRPDLTPGELQTAWTAMAGADATSAYEQICRLIQSPRQTLPFLAENLAPVPRTDPREIARLVLDLDSKKFKVRAKAYRELEKLAEVARPALEKALQAHPSAEVRQRVERLLKRLNSPTPSPERLRTLRAVEVLEHIGTREASRLLGKLAGGAPDTALTREAKAAFKRLAKWPSDKK
jgi:hypothetical protein